MGEQKEQFSGLGKRLAKQYLAALPYLKAAGAAGGAYMVGSSGYTGYKMYSKKKTPYKVKRIRKLVRINKSDTNAIKIKKINQKLNNNEANISYRNRTFATSRIGFVDQCVYQSYVGLDKTLIELAVTNLQYYDINNAGTLVTADFNTGTFNRQVLLQPSSTFTIRNNYRIPVMVEVYICRVKSDTSQTPFDAITEGFLDVGSLAVTDELSRHSDSRILRDLWSVKKKYKAILPAGSQRVFSHREKAFSYDASLAQTHNLQFIKQFKSYQWLTRLEGVVGHNPSGSVIGKMQGSIDCVMQTHIQIKYDAGGDLIRVQTSITQGLLATPVVTVIDNSQEAYGL